MNTIELYQQIKQKLNANWMSELKEETLTIKSETIDINQAWSIIKDFAPTQGWIQTLDKTDFVSDFDDQNIADVILSAEMINANGQTLHIRPVNKGKLSITTYFLDGASFFYTETSHQIKLGKQTGIASYRLYWQQNNQQTHEIKDNKPRQAQFSRLVGFEFKGSK